MEDGSCRCLSIRLQRNPFGRFTGKEEEYELCGANNRSKKEDKPPEGNRAKKQAKELCDRNSDNDENLTGDAECASQTLWRDFIDVKRNQYHRLDQLDRGLRMYHSR
jgi:hypothetical protein